MIRPLSIINVNGGGRPNAVERSRVDLGRCEPDLPACSWYVRTSGNQHGNRSV
jgi:hypothetical protein